MLIHLRPFASVRMFCSSLLLDFLAKIRYFLKELHSFAYLLCSNLSHPNSLACWLYHWLLFKKCCVSSLCVCCVSVTQLCLTLCSPMDCSPPGSSVHGILQARILRWVAMPSSRESSQPRDPIQVSLTAGGFFIVCATRQAPEA